MAKKKATVIDGTEGNPLKIKAKEFGFQGMFYTPDPENVQGHVDKYMSALTQEDKMPAMIMLYGIVNVYALELAKAHIALEAHDIELTE